MTGQAGLGESGGVVVMREDTIDLIWITIECIVDIIFGRIWEEIVADILGIDKSLAKTSSGDLPH